MDVIKVAKAEEQLKVKVNKLSPKDGDIIVVKIDTQVVSNNLISKIAEEIRNNIPNPNVQALIIDESLDISLISEDGMRKFGWIRAIN